MLGNAPGLPLVLVHNLAQAAGLVVEPPHVAFERRPQPRDALRRPDGAEDLPRRRGAGLGSRVVVLRKNNVAISMGVTRGRRTGIKTRGLNRPHNVAFRDVGESLRDVLGHDERVGKQVEARVGGGLIGRRALRR